MLTLFAIPDQASIITTTTPIVTAFVAEFLPVIYLSLGILVFVGTILYVKMVLNSGASKVLGGKRGRRRRKKR